MKIAYVVAEEQRAMAQAHAHALATRGHDVDVLEEAEDGYELIVGRDVETSRAFEIGAIVAAEFYRAKNPPENEPMRVLIAGASQNESNGIDEGYGAVAHARWFHQKIDLIRVAPWVPSREEPLDGVQEFHVGLDTRERARLVQTCDVLVAPRHTDAAFDLTAAEAMAAGVPVVMTSTTANLALDPTPDYAAFAPVENAVELGEKLIEVLTDFDLRERLRTRGRVLAEQWRAGRVIDRLEAFFVEQLSVRQR